MQQGLSGVMMESDFSVANACIYADRASLDLKFFINNMTRRLYGYERQLCAF